MHDEEIIRKIAEFYHQNWRGNKDFLHMPSIGTVADNCEQYPILIARERDKTEILAISTIKHNKNTNDNLDPYFPVEDTEYFSITGILVKKDCQYKGLGKKMYEIGIIGAYGYNMQYPGTRFIFEIDCRNVPSHEGGKVAVQRINETVFAEKNKALPSNIVGYYLLTDDEGEMLEAPTFILEVGLEEAEIEKAKPNEEVLSFSKEEPAVETVEKFLGSSKSVSPIVCRDEVARKHTILSHY